MSRPRFVEPQAATLVDEPPDVDGWILERRFDGLRTIVVRDGTVVRLFAPDGIDRSRSFPEIAEALAAQPPDRYVVDGEIVACDDGGSVARDDGGAVARIHLNDLLHLDGRDLTDRPLRNRKERLHEAFDLAGDIVRGVEHRSAVGSGAMLAEACHAGWAGLVARRADAPYRSGPSPDRLEVRCTPRQQLVIGGWSDAGDDETPGALLVGYHVDGRLVYAGRVETRALPHDPRPVGVGRGLARPTHDAPPMGGEMGVDALAIERLAGRLRRRCCDEPPFVDAPDLEGVHWVHPDLVCEVGFTTWTGDGRIRDARLFGLRYDTPPAEVVREDVAGTGDVVGRTDVP